MADKPIANTPLSDEEVAALHDYVQRRGTPPSQPAAMPTQLIPGWSLKSLIAALRHTLRR